MPGEPLAGQPADEEAVAELVAADVVEVARVVVAAELVVPGQVEQAPLRGEAELVQDQHAVVAEGEVGAVLVVVLAGVVALGDVAVVDADLDVGLGRRLDLRPHAPHRGRIGGDPIGEVEERRWRLAAEAVGDELAVQRRGQEVVGRRQPAVGKVEPVVVQRGDELRLDQPDPLAAAVELLHADGVADVLLAEAVAGALRAGDPKGRVRHAEQRLEVEVGLEQDVVDVGLALLAAADGVGHELHGVAAAKVTPRSPATSARRAMMSLRSGAGLERAPPALARKPFPGSSRRRPERMRSSR